MKILVTGGAGFIGSHLVDALVAKGHEVAVLDDLSTGVRSNVPQGVRLHELDIRSAVAAEVVRKGGFEVIYHQAAQMNVRRSVSDPAFDAEVNILGSLNLLEAAVQGGVQQVIFASSGGAGYGEQQAFPAPEEHAKQPESPYGIAKISVELYLHFYAQTHGLRYVALRYGNVYGPRQNPKGEAGVVAIFSELLLQGQQPKVNGTGTQTRDYVHVADVVRANLLALQAKENGAYNIATGTETSVVELLALLQKVAGTHMDPAFVPGKAGEQQRSVLDISKAKRDLGWEPQVGLEEGFTETVGWFRQKLGL